MAASAPDTGWWAHLWPCYSCCQQIWIPSLGQFSSQCLGVVSHIPLWVAMTTVVLRYGVGPILHCYRPVWLRRFTAEQDALPVADVDQEAGDQSPPLKVVWTSWNRCLLLLGMVIAALGAIGAAIWPEHAEVYLTPVLPSFVSSLMVVVERPRTTPGSVFIINSATTIVELLILTVLPSAVPNGWPQAIAWIAGVFLPLLSVILMLNMPMRDPLLDSSNISRPFTQPSPDVRSPEDAVTLWQWMTVSWMAPLMKVGYERQLHDEDVWLLPYDFHHSRLHLLFREVSGTVFTRLLKANGLDLVITTTLAVLETSIELVGPILLKQLLAALTAEQPNVRAAIVYAGITLVSRLVQAQSGVFSLWFQRRAYERSRGELITMIHEKTLRRKAFTFSSGQEAPEGAAEQEQGSGSKTTSGSATLADDGSGNKVDADPDSLRSRFQQFKSMVSFNYSKPNPPKPEPIPASPSPEQTPASTGKILNLLRNDAYEIAQRFWESPNIVTKPLSFLVSLVLVWRILGPASLSGILVLLTCMAINALLMRLMLHIEQVRREITDNKLQRTSQFVESIRHLRWYDWQDAWLSKIMESRKDELIRRVQSNVVLKGISAVNNLGAYLFPVAGFWAYTLVEGRPLTVDVAFPALNLFTMLQDSLRELPNLVTVLLNAKVSMDRIEAFMLEPEKEGLDRDLAFGEGEGPPGELEIIFRNASFSWPGSAKEVLRDVSIACRPGLTLVCGKVGIGKTALLQAILGELDQHGGERIVPSEVIGYCAQTPWLESMSIRENILFSAVYDKARFEKVIDACCLRDDLDQFRAKDLTLIGENGVGLSGGQRARVALARAIYSQARVLLLDDPIAALDHHTATSLLANLFSDKNSPLTAGRLIIFVTHRVDIVTPYAYQVIEIVDGGRAETFDGKELENNEEELEHLAEIANTAPPPPDTEEDEPVADKFIEEERRVHGGVLASVYWQYIKAGRLGWWSFMIGGFILFRTVRIAYFWFLKEWGEQYQDPPSGIYSLHAGMGDYAETSQHVVISQSIFHISGASTNGTWLDLGRYLPAPDQDVRPWLVWFLVLSVSQVLASALSDAALVVVMYQAGKNLFAQAMSRVTNATFRFYDVTPVGRLMNRLTSDMGTVDGQIAGQLTTVAWYTIGWLSAVAVISSATPLFLVISVTMTALFVLTFNWFLPTSQSLRRLETVSLSPLMSNFGTLVEGLTTVRAYRAEPHFQNRIIATTDAFQKMDHFYWSLQAWLQYRFDILSALTTFILTLCAILTGLSSGTVGFVLASAANFVRSTHSLCRKYGELQMQFVSVERIVELLSLEQEPRGGFLPPAAWPGYGDDIVFDNVTLRYAPQLETVLHNVSFTIPGGANVAVTGRTASGKSTLALALLGTLHPDPDTDGSIRIGAVDLLDVDKHTLRRNITFVAQDPVLFPGTLRDNLDPLGERDETERAEVLERVLGRSGSFTLDSRVDGGGKNLSQGQRQLVGLGRAMLRRSPVVIMDEATASIDAETAAYIQRLLREELRYSTVITIAHKAEAVEDADWEVVLDKGRVVRAGPRGRRRA